MRRGAKRGACRGSLDDFELHFGEAAFDHLQLLSRGEGEIDDATGNKRTTVVDADGGRALVAKIRDFDFGAEFEIPMRRRHLMHVEDFATGRLAAVKFVRIVGSLASGGFWRFGSGRDWPCGAVARAKGRSGREG